MKSVFSKTKAIVLALILAFSVCAFAACNPSGNEGGGGNGGGNGGNGGNGGTTTDKTVVQLIEEAQVIFNKAGKAVSNATAGLADSLTQLPQTRTMSVKSAPRIALLSDEKPSGGDDIPSAPTLDDLEGFVLLSYLKDTIRQNFGETEYWTAEDFGGDETSPGIGDIKHEGAFIRLSRKFKELDALFAQESEDACVTIPNEAVPSAPSYVFKRDGGYLVSEPILRQYMDGDPNLTEDEKNEIIARNEVLYKASGNTVGVSNDTIVQEGDKPLPENIDPSWAAEKSSLNSFTVEGNIASSGSIEVVSAEDGVYVRFCGLNLEYAWGAENELSQRWEEYKENLRQSGVNGGDLETCWQFPNEVYGVAKFAPDGTSGTVKLFRNYSHDAGGPKDAAGNPQYERGTYPLPEKWLTSFNAETALDISGLEGNWLQHKQRYLCTFNFTGLPVAEEKK